MLAAGVAAAWLLHPLMVSTVLYTVQRMTELSTLFVLAGLVCYLQGRRVQADSPGAGWALIGFGFFVFYPLAVLSKENALLFPVYCTLIEWVVLRARGNERVSRQIKLMHGVLILSA